MENLRTVSLLILWWSGSGLACRSTSCSRPPVMCPRIYSREEWGARPPVQESESIGDNLPFVFVHHSALETCGDMDSCIQAVQAIQNLHMDVNKWWDIGYSFLIGGDGSVFEGRGWNTQGAHTAGFNNLGYGVCFLGDFTGSIPSSPAIQAYHNLVFCMKEEGKISQDFRMFGHRQTKEAGKTECPGDAFFATIQTWPRWDPCTVEDPGCFNKTLS